MIFMAMNFTNTFWALIPPLVAIVLALITKETYSSLFIGVVVGALLVTKFNVVSTLDTIVSDGLINAVSENAGIYVFLVILGAIVSLTASSGGSQAFGKWASKNIKTRIGAQIATFFLGVLIFIDDYFNCLTVGAVMKPVTDTHKISRVKLAYLIDATAAPICMIAPISSWAAAVSGVADGLHSNVSGIELFIRAIPYNFYSLLTFVFIIALVILKIDYGPMAEYELKAIKEGETFALSDDNAATPNSKGKLFDMIIPVIVLIIMSTICMLNVGGFFDAKGEYYHDLLNAFGNTDAFVALPQGGLITLIFTIIYMLLRRILSFKDSMKCLIKGFEQMVPPIIILTLAVSLKTMTSSLGADVFVHDLMSGAANSLYSLLPAIIFVVALILAFASGTSWGTFGILIPIVVAVFNESSPLLTIGISACLAGAVCGDHCSPISDTTIMSSAGANCDHITHVSTQLPYALTVAGVSFVMFIIAGFLQNPWICIAIGLILTVAVLIFIKKFLIKDTAKDTE